MDVKNILRDRRIELGLTMKDVAQRTCVSEATVSRWESGDIENMKRDKIAALARALSISPSVIMGWDNYQEEDHQGGYYVDKETAEIAQEIFENPDTRALFDASRGSRPEDLRMAADLLLRLKRTNPDG